MENSNGYFQVVNSGRGTLIRLVPETGTGKKIEVNEVKEYLECNNIENFDLVSLGKAITTLKEEKTVFVSSNKGYVINEYMKVAISEDKMRAKVRFYPPSNTGSRMTIEEMKAALEAEGVTYGIDDRVFKYQLKKSLYCTDYIVARGKSVREGKDADIEYLFNTNRQAKPKRNKDGSVDFHQLNNISHVKEGDVLAILHPEDNGENGINVKGEIIKPRAVAHVMLKYGKNIELSEDKMSLISKVNGHAILEGDRVFVSNVYDVPADVDNSTGDIEYGGNVLVHGNVRTGFKIKATGDIEVLGSVEGAELVSGGNVILHHGMQGMSKGKIIAKGNVISKFIESAKVFAGGYIEVEAIIQSQISANGDVNVNGQKGHIIGGYIRSATNISAKIIGSAMGISTLVEVGFEPEIQDRINNIKNDIKDKNKKLINLTQVSEVLNKRLQAGIINQQQKLTLKSNLKNIQILKAGLINDQEELDNLLKKSSNGNNNSFIKVYNSIFPGVQLRISSECYNINEELSYCKFYKLNGEIQKGAI